MSPHQNPEEASRHVKQTLHANFLVIDKIGVLITGKTNFGKSELSLALIDRGHQLVCDDVVDIKKEKNQLIGTCPSIANGYILITGIGIIDVPKLFGLNAVINEHEIHLSIILVKPEEMPSIENPLNPLYQSEIILDIKLPKIFISMNRKHLPLLIEILVRNHRLKMEDCNNSNLYIHEYFQKEKEREYL